MRGPACSAHPASPRRRGFILFSGKPGCVIGLYGENRFETASPDGQHGCVVYSSKASSTTIATLTLPEARRQFDSLPGQQERDPDTPVVITEGGKQVMVVLSWDRYESLLETSAIRKDRNLSQAIEEGVREIEEGKGVAWDEAQRRLGWDRL